METNRTLSLTVQQIAQYRFEQACVYFKLGGNISHVIFQKI